MKILSMPAGAPAPTGRLDIYKDGTQYLSLDNNYTASDPTTPVTFESDHIAVVNGASNVCICGTTLPIDLTNYAAVHVIYKLNSGDLAPTIYINNAKTTTNYVTRGATGTSNTYVEATLDISAITGDNYVFFATDHFNTNSDIKEIWLTEQ